MNSKQERPGEGLRKLAKWVAKEKVQPAALKAFLRELIEVRGIELDANARRWASSFEPPEPFSIHDLSHLLKIKADEMDAG